MSSSVRGPSMRELWAGDALPDAAPPVLRWGVLSTARIAKKNCRAIALSSCGELVAVASRSLDRAAAFVREHGCVREPGAVRAYGSYQELLDDENVDAVYIPLPTAMHREWVIKAARRKKHVLVEKPVALSLAEFDEMMAACDENGVLLMDGVMFMHNKRLLKLCEEFHEQLGSMRARPLRITSAFSFYGDRAFFERDIRTKPDADPLGCLGDLGWYCVRFAMCCMSFHELDKPTAAKCVSMRRNCAGVPTDCEAVVRWGDGYPINGATLSFHASFHAPWRQWVEVCSGEKVLTMDDFVISRPADSRFKVESTQLSDLGRMSAERVFSTPDVNQVRVP